VKLAGAAAASPGAGAGEGAASTATYAALERERTFASAPDPIRSVLQHSKSHPRMLESACFYYYPAPASLSLPRTLSPLSQTMLFFLSLSAHIGTAPPVTRSMAYRLTRLNPHPHPIRTQATPRRTSGR
jgi:hypothetical protein